MKKALDKILLHKRNILAVSFGQVIAALGTLVGVRLVTEFVSPDLFGEYKLMLAGISLITGVFIRPFIQFSMREYHDAEKSGVLTPFLENTTSFFRSYLLIIVVLAAALIKITQPQWLNNSLPVLSLMLTVLVVASSVELNRALMVTKNWQVLASLVSVFRNWLVPLLIVMGIVVIGENIVIMLAATVLVLSALLFIQKLVLRRSSGRAKNQCETLNRKDYHRAALSFGIPLAAVGIMSWLVHESDRFFLSYFHSESVVGIYSAAYGLVSAPFTLIVGSMAQLLYPIMFKASANDDRENRNNILKGMLLVSTSICIIGLIIVGLFDRQIAWLALGEAYREEASGLLFWIAFGYGLHAISMSFDLAAYGSKRTTDMLLAYGVAAITNVTLNIFLVPENGALGAVIATFLALLLYLVTMAVLFYYREMHDSRGSKVASE